MGRAINVMAVVLALSLAGCSLFMKTNAKNWEPRLAPTCSDSKTAPVVDSVVAGLGVAAASYGGICLSVADGHKTRNSCTNFALIPGIAAALVYGVPALVGWHRIKTCRRAKRKNESWLRPDYPPENETPSE